MIGFPRVGWHGLAVCGLLLNLGHVRAEEKIGPKCVSASGIIIARKALDAPWTIVEKDAVIPFGHMLVTLPDASVQSGNGAVKITSRADYDNRSPLPIMETAFTINPPGKNDFDIVLDRGRVELLNTKTKGAATVVVHFLDQKWTVELNEPKSRVTLEIYGRWPRGSVFRPNLNSSPNLHLVLLVTDGTANIDTGEFSYPLEEPPGYALLEWQNVGRPHSPVKLDKLPTWADPDAELSDFAKKAKALLEEFRKLRVETSPDKALDAFMDSKDPFKERIALISSGAQDDMMRLGKALTETRDFEIWDTGIIVLRHWVGRGPGYDRKLFDSLTAKREYKPIQARIIMHLLMGFDDDTLQTPELYELLIEYLKSDAPAIRNLSAWHLYRMLPDMRKKVPYQPNGTSEDYAKLYDAWKEAIPAGKLPMAVTTPDDKPIRPKQ